MKFTAAILLFVQFANADGHATNSTSVDHAETHPDHMREAALDDDLEVHINDQHERLAMALEMVEMFCDHHEDSDKEHDTTDGEATTADPTTRTRSSEDVSPGEQMLRDRYQALQDALAGLDETDPSRAVFEV